uniref:Protein kinase domain-containing protein n=1 Tax=Acrobeloides nanus TaxID=290746 RepID=A0A914BYC6_9BILA
MPLFYRNDTNNINDFERVKSIMKIMLNTCDIAEDDNISNLRKLTIFSSSSQISFLFLRHSLDDAMFKIIPTLLQGYNYGSRELYIFANNSCMSEKDTIEYAALSLKKQLKYYMANLDVNIHWIINYAQSCSYYDYYKFNGVKVYQSFNLGFIKDDLNMCPKLNETSSDQSSTVPYTNTVSIRDEENIIEESETTESVEDDAPQYWLWIILSSSFSIVFIRIIWYKGIKSLFDVLDDSNISVAIKVFHKDQVKNSWQEIHLIKSLQHHPFIVNMLGWTKLDIYGPCLILEFCANGNLLTFLQGLRPLIKNNVIPSAPYQNCLCIKDLIVRAWQISDAMIFLSRNNLVHRDLAARNILLTDKMVAKVADFGLCRKITDSPCAIASRFLPLKWLAIETLRTLEYSEKTDVWSFGILLYEMFSIGLQPYSTIELSKGHNFSQEELLDFLETGGRLERPALCPDNIYNLMLSCWESSTEQRPSFKEIKSTLSNVLEAPDAAYGYVQVIKDQKFSNQYCHIVK